MVTVIGRGGSTYHERRMGSTDEDRLEGSSGYWEKQKEKATYLCRSVKDILEEQVSDYEPHQ